MLDALLNIDGWKQIVEIGGTIAAIMFTGVALHIDARVRRAQTLIEITKQHRELWMYFDEHPKLARLFEQKRDLRRDPLTDPELRFANFLFLHLRATYGARRAKIHNLPEEVEDDWQELFSHPAVSAAWDRVKHLHDRDIVALVEGYRKQRSVTRPEYPVSRERVSS